MEYQSIKKNESKQEITWPTYMIACFWFNNGLVDEIVWTV